MKGSYIRQQRTAMRMTQPQLGVLIGVDGTQVSRWERGVFEPGPDAEEKLREVFAGRERRAPEDVSVVLARIEAKLDELLSRGSS